MAGDAPIRIIPGANQITFVDAKGDSAKTIVVYTYLPKSLASNTARIVFVMHGHGKNAKGMRDAWVQHADTNGWMIVAPLFDPRQWSGGDYAYSSVMTRAGQIRDESLWSFSVIEHLFDAIKEATGNRSADYFIYGHSAGGQFVHRLVLLLAENRCARAIAANSGWYTVPRFDIKFPYGLGGSPATEASLQKSFARDFTLMLGDRDTDPNHPELRKTARAMTQGSQRFERGHNFMKEARQRATQLGVDIAWQFQVVAGAAHENEKMSRAAAALLMAR
ncbi:MAG: hypothetical protein FJ145_26190 [Deltaproteobacteria bacterium]|nr:hypothetical protein [Deltaproteobacteria bacterium]